LKDYLEERILEGEKIAPDSPLITPKLRMKPFIRTVNIGDTIRLAIRSAGFPWRPYVLRSFFDTQLMMAESKGHVIRDYRTFWMGHRGDIENRYTTNRKRLPENGQLQNKCKQRVSTADEAERLIEDGWQYVGSLPNGKVVVKKQASG
jgi:hypothetical protein